jgi:hypothetical protein
MTTKSAETPGQQSGRTQTEILAVFALLVLMGVSIFSLAAAGSTAYRKTNESKTAQIEVRVAMSFIQMKIHQSDAAESIRIEPNPINGASALVLSETLSGRRYDTWVYFDDGSLREALVLSGEGFGNGEAFPVANLDGFEIGANATGSGLFVRAWSHDGKSKMIQSQTSLAMRSGGVR